MIWWCIYVENGDEYCWWMLLINIVDGYFWWKLMMNIVDGNCGWLLMTCVIAYEYMQCRVICSCIHGQVLLLMAIVDGKLVMIIMINSDGGSIDDNY